MTLGFFSASYIFLRTPYNNIVNSRKVLPRFGTFNMYLCTITQKQEKYNETRESFHVNIGIYPKSV